MTVQGESVLAQIARELWAILRRDVKTDWTVRDDVRAKLRSSVKRLLVKYKYPPDQQPEAIRLVIEQLRAWHPAWPQKEQSDDRSAQRPMSWRTSSAIDLWASRVDRLRLGVLATAGVVPPDVDEMHSNLTDHFGHGGRAGLSGGGDQQRRCCSGARHHRGSLSGR